MRMGMSHFSRPPRSRMVWATPASTAPVFMTTPRKPPTIRMNTQTSTASKKPEKAAFSTAPTP